jgi:hypothetical protein
MKPAFPGMNPYLEDPDLWPEVHSWLMVLLARSLNPQLTPKYRAAIEKRVYTDSLLVGIPDVSIFQTQDSTPQKRATAILSQPVKVNVPAMEEIQESYLEIRRVGTGQVVTVIEVLSPKNKRVGEGREQYNLKRRKVLSSLSHLVEIDLLRTGSPQPMSSGVASDYRVLVSRSDYRPEAELYPFDLTHPIPLFPLPLQAGDAEPVVDLKTILDTVYDEASLNFAIDYSQQPIPPLSKQDFEWIQMLVDNE